MTVADMMGALRAEEIRTWFDLGLFIDRFKEDRQVPAAESPTSFQNFCDMLVDGGIAFITFDEDRSALMVNEYTRVLNEVLGNIPTHHIAGAFHNSSPLKHELKVLQGFEKWPLYHDFFGRRLERGGERYNQLIREFWDDVLAISQRLGEIIQAKQIRLLYLINICSTPGNVSLSLATVFISEWLGIPVINHNLDYYWSKPQSPFFTNAHLGEFFSQIQVLFPWESRSWMNVNASRQLSQHLIEIKGHNPANVGEISPTAQGVNRILYRLYLQLGPNELELAGRAIEEYRETCTRDLDTLLPKNQHYLPGYGRTSFMLFLKSLIDPSYFRVEEQQIRGMVMSFAQKIVRVNSTSTVFDVETRHRFFNAIDNLFLYQAGVIKTRHDHSFSYRHRNTRYYPYRDFTHQELTGLVNLLFHQLVHPAPVRNHTSQRPAVANLALDDRDLLMKRLHSDAPMAYFPGEYSRETLETLILRPIRARLRLEEGEKITSKELKESGDPMKSVTIFCPEKSCGKRVTTGTLMRRVANEEIPELSLLYRHGLCKIIPTQQWCVGIHFPQLGEQALKQLVQIKEQGGYLVSDDEDAAMMTDVVALDRFHIGQARHPLSAKIMGIPLNSSYVQFAPAGIRTTLAYPTPIQTAKDFSNALKSSLYAKLCQEHGETKVLKRVQEDAQRQSTPIKAVLESLVDKGATGKRLPPVKSSSVRGLYRDKQPWSGVLARIDISQSQAEWRFAILTGNGKTQPVTAFTEEFRMRCGRTPAVAWNGGYILNAELVGKLGLPESYIGSPLGLIISNGQVLCPPLFNKAALLVYPDGRLEIKKANCRQGLVISGDHHCFTLGPANRNPKEPAADEICVYDLLHDQRTIRGNGRVILRLAGNVIKEIIRSGPDQDVLIIPVGLTLSFPTGKLPYEWNQVGKSVQIEMRGWDKIEHAIEAGPMLVEAGQNCLDMASEGWKTANSIRTQAARLDYTDMRGPKIAVGLDGDGSLSVLAIDGRIRESVGASHVEMAEILIDLGIQTAMGFDPGGSSTLLVLDRVLNISPYNANYENDVYSLPPEPRAVASAIIGYQVQSKQNDR